MELEREVPFVDGVEGEVEEGGDGVDGAPFLPANTAVLEVIDKALPVLRGERLRRRYRWWQLFRHGSCVLGFGDGKALV